MKKQSAFQRIIAFCLLATGLSLQAAQEYSITDSSGSISSEPGTYGIQFTDATGPNSLTMDGGSLSVSNINVDVTLIKTEAGAASVTANISGGNVTAKEEATKAARWLNSNSAGSIFNISGGDFLLYERGSGSFYGFRISGAGSQLNISDGRFEIDHWVTGGAGTTDGNWFILVGGANVTLSGGNFIPDPTFPTKLGIDHNGTGTFTLDCDTYSSAGITLDANSLIQETSGTVSGTFRDGNTFSFSFDRASASAKIKVLGTDAASANIVTVPPSITNTVVGANAIGFKFESTNLEKDTLLINNGGEIRITKTGTGTLYGIWTQSDGAANPSIAMTNGVLDFHEENAGSVHGIFLQKANSSIEISGGTVDVFEYGHNEPFTFNVTGSGSSVDISGGTFSVLQHVTDTDLADSRQGYLFNMEGDNSTLTVSGGDFSQLNDAPTTNYITPAHGGTLEPPTRHIILTGASAGALLETATYNPDALTIDGSGNISDLTGTISGEFADGNTFSFNFERDADTTLKVTGTPASGYGTWESSFGVDIGDESNDFENDGMNNLLEYALGGNPTTNDAAIVLPKSEINGNALYYISKQVKDDDVTISVGTMLTLGDTLNTNDVSVVGTPADDGEYLTVTNSTPMTENVKFIGLKVSK